MNSLKQADQEILLSYLKCFEFLANIHPAQELADGVLQLRAVLIAGLNGTSRHLLDVERLRGTLKEITEY